MTNANFSAMFSNLPYSQQFMVKLSRVTASTVFARLCKLGNFSVSGVLSNIRITTPPNECRLRCYVPQQEMADRRQTISCACWSPKSAKNWGGGGGGGGGRAALNRANTVLQLSLWHFISNVSVWGKILHIIR